MKYAMESLILTVAFLSSVGGTALAADAKELFQQGKEHYSQGQYEKAIASFEAAGKIRPSPILDYNIARCHENLGNTQKAIEYYERYLDKKPDADNSAQVRERVATLKRAAAPEKPVPPDPSSAANEPEMAKEAPPPVTPPGSAEEPGAPGPVHEATLPPESGKARETRTAQRSPHARPAPSRQPRRDPYGAPGKRDQGPFYKQWWFWAACAGAAVIVGFVIYTASSRSDRSSSNKEYGLQQGAGGLQLRF
jgi:tetratricopeptide (TPR) repeat protein